MYIISESLSALHKSMSSTSEIWWESAAGMKKEKSFKVLERGRFWLFYVLHGLDTHAIVCSAYAISTDMKCVLKLVLFF
jgi:hypothetical protein